MQIVVIGAGMIGASATYRLAEAGARVMVLEAGRPGWGTSGTTFSWLNAFSKTPRAYFDLNLAGMAEYTALAGALEGAAWLHQVGHLTWARRGEEQTALRADFERATSWGYEAERLSCAEARTLEPDLALEPEAEVVYLPSEGWVETRPLIHALLERAVALGATVRDGTRVVAIARRGGRVEGLLTEAGERIPADVVVDSAGPWAAEVAAMAGLALPLEHQPGLMVYSAPLATCLRCVCDDRDVYFRPDGGGRIAMGQYAYDHSLQLDAPNADQADSIVSRVARSLPVLAGTRPETARVGIRPYPRDGLPMLGFMPDLDGFYAAVSHSAITLGPLWGRLVAAEVHGGRPEPRLEPFRPDRFLSG